MGRRADGDWDGRFASLTLPNDPTLGDMEAIEEFFGLMKQEIALVWKRKAKAKGTPSAARRTPNDQEGPRALIRGASKYLSSPPTLMSPRRLKSGAACFRKVPAIGSPRLYARTRPNCFGGFDSHTFHANYNTNRSIRKPRRLAGGQRFSTTVDRHYLLACLVGALCVLRGRDDERGLARLRCTRLGC